MAGRSAPSHDRNLEELSKSLPTRTAHETHRAPSQRVRCPGFLRHHGRALDPTPQRLAVADKAPGQVPGSKRPAAPTAGVAPAGGNPGLGVRSGRHFRPDRCTAGTRETAPQRPWPSPEVTADRTTRFHLQAPEARSVRLQSSDLQGAGLGELPGLQRDTNGVWACTVGPVPPGAYRDRFLVDGVPVTDPRNPTVSESHETVWSLVRVPGSEWFDVRAVPHGAVASVGYWSTTLQRHRRMHVYTPPGYESGPDRYPVLYLLHGATDSDHSWSSVGRAGMILDNLIAAGRARPMLVFMPHGHTGPFRFGMRFGEEFERDFLTDLWPEVERRYRVRPGRQHRAIAGLSMGGMQALNLLMQRPEAFSQVGVFRSGVFGLGGGPARPSRTLPGRTAPGDADPCQGPGGVPSFVVRHGQGRFSVGDQPGDRGPVPSAWMASGVPGDRWRAYVEQLAGLPGGIRFATLPGKDIHGPAHRGPWGHSGSSFEHRKTVFTRGAAGPVGTAARSHRSGRARTVGHGKGVGGPCRARVGA